jgi:hypothetical protein
VRQKKKKKKEKERKKVRLHLQVNPQSFRSLIDKVDEGESSKVKETFWWGYGVVHKMRSFLKLDNPI